MDTVSFVFRQLTIVLRNCKFISNTFFYIIFTRSFIKNINDTALVEMDVCVPVIV